MRGKREILVNTKIGASKLSVRINNRYYYPGIASANRLNNVLQGYKPSIFIDCFGPNLVYLINRDNPVYPPPQ